VFATRIALACATLAVLAAAAPTARGADSTASAATAPDPRAIRIADQVMQALGGKDQWDALPGLRWNFGAVINDTLRSHRRHAWNKHSGWHRVGYKSATGDSFCIIHKVGTSEGRAWVNGNAIEGDSLQKLIARGMRIWTNDTYWMLMPYKMRDPGVNLVWDSEKQRDGKTYDVLSMTFGKVGQTPGDHYWVYVNRANHRVELWDMVLEGNAPPAVTYTWDDWVRSGGLWFPTAHRQERRNVFTKDVEAVTRFAPNEFTAH
jgi:hypothetical protein